MLAAVYVYGAEVEICPCFTANLWVILLLPFSLSTEESRSMFFIGWYTGAASSPAGSILRPSCLNRLCVLLEHWAPACRLVVLATLYSVLLGGAARRQTVPARHWTESLFPGEWGVGSGEGLYQHGLFWRLNLFLRQSALVGEPSHFPGPSLVGLAPHIRWGGFLARWISPRSFQPHRAPHDCLIPTHTSVIISRPLIGTVVDG